MKSYREYIGTAYSGLSGREGTEWSNFWFDRSDSQEGGRILLVGDSTSRKVRSTLARMSGRPVDLLGSSSALDDELFVSQVDCFFTGTLYRYDIIFVQVGNHSRISKDGTPYTDADHAKFRRDYLALLSFLGQFAPIVIPQTVLTMVHAPAGKLHYLLRRLHLEKELPDREANAVLLKKNETILEASVEAGLKPLDICTMIGSRGFPRVDHVHYGKTATREIAVMMMDAAGIRK